MRGLEYPCASVVDDVCDGGSVGEVGERLLCPAGDIGEGVLAAVQTMRGGDEVGDGFGLDLATAPANRGAVGGGLVEQDVPQFVGQGLDGLGVVDVVADLDGPGGVVGVAVRAVAVPERRG